MLRIALVAFVLALGGAVTPGPVLALVVGQTLAQGIRAAPAILAGHAALEIVVVIAIALGAGRILARQGLRAAVSLTGAAVLTWLAVDMLRSLPRLSISAEAANPMPLLALFAGGIGASIANPYFTAWWATIGTGQVATLRIRTLPQYLAFYFGHEMGDVVWYMLVAVLLSTGRGLLSDTAYKALIAVAAVAMLGLAAWFTAEAAKLVVASLSPAAQEKASDGN